MILYRQANELDLFDIAETVNNDPDTKDLLKVVGIPNDKYSVKLGELVYPAANFIGTNCYCFKEASY